MTSVTSSSSVCWMRLYILNFVPNLGIWIIRHEGTYRITRTANIFIQFWLVSWHVRVFLQLKMGNTIYLPVLRSYDYCVQVLKDNFPERLQLSSQKGHFKLVGLFGSLKWTTPKCLDELLLTSELTLQFQVTAGSRLLLSGFKYSCFSGFFILHF